MTLAIIGVNHKTAPIELRERISHLPRGTARGHPRLGRRPRRSRMMIVSTCNRVEILAATESPAIDLTGFLQEHFGLDPALLKAHI